MTADQLRRLAVLIERTDYEAIDRAAAYLRACADALEKGPVAWRYKKEGGGWFVSDNDPQYVEQWNDIEKIKPLYPLAMPAPLRLPEPMTNAEIDAARYRLLRRKFAIISDGNGNAEFCPINLPRPTYIAPNTAIELDTALDRERLGMDGAELEPDDAR